MLARHVILEMCRLRHNILYKFDNIRVWQVNGCRGGRLRGRNSILQFDALTR